MDPFNEPMDDLDKAQHLDTRNEFTALEAELTSLIPSREPEADHARRSEHMAIERLLFDTQPTAPSDLLGERIAHGLAEEDTVPMNTRSVGFRWIPAFAAVAAVAVAVLTLYGLGVFNSGDGAPSGIAPPLVADNGERPGERDRQPAVPAAPGLPGDENTDDTPAFDPEFDALAGIKRYTPVSANRYLLGARHAVRDVGELGPMRVTVVRTMDEVEYKHPEKNRRIIISRPKENLVVTDLESF